ncbi:MAG TPA: FecR domain-containing protein [Caulobacteraceae bacterium]
MSERETAEAINEQAMRWIARLDREGRDGDLQAELDTWLGGDPRRQGAFLRAEAAWGLLDRAGVLTPEAEEGEVAPPTRRGLLLGGGLAAALAATAGSWLAYRALCTVRIRTVRGEIRRVPLADGSMAIVNTDTSVRVDLQPDLRAVALDDGEAWFQVARDKDRPFVVKVGDVRVRAVGTAFSVRRTAGGAVVQVTEGVVETWCVGEESAAVRVAAGGKAYVAPQAGPAVTRDAGEIDRSLAWRTGLIVLDGDTLGQAAEEFNRYNNRQIVIEDNELASQTYVGRFRTNEPEAFVKSVALTLGARARETPDAFLIYRE